MKNKIHFKRYVFLTILIILLFNICSYIFNRNVYQKYQKNYNSKLNGIVDVLDKYNVSKNEIMEILNNDISSTDNFKEYGIDINSDSVILKNKHDYNRYIIYNFILITFFSLILFIIFLINNYLKNKKLKEITNYIKNINNKIYLLDIDSNTEDELSILKNELYRITVSLKEASINSNKDKLVLKNSLEDISHQLKTPLTAINILIDTILENDNIDNSKRNKFLKDIKREINNMNFLILNILKLSKFDSNTIEFNRKNIDINDIIIESIHNLEPLLDLKNININYKKQHYKLNLDAIWEIEAITNIIKNAIEHSNSNIDIIVEDLNLYTRLIIRDYGVGLDDEDKKNIFKRFYKGKNGSKDSFGIGLSLASKIIEKDNGVIRVESKLNEGTSFIIKYFKDV